MNHNKLVTAMAERAGKLANMSMYELRMIVGTDDSACGRHQECLGMSKGALIEFALDREFEEPEF